MKPETRAYLEKADGTLNKARRVLEIKLTDEAGRHAYFAAFHAAQAMIFEHTDKAAKSHSGVKAEFARLAKIETRIDRKLTTFLAKAYQLKSAADYETEPSAIITVAEARNAISLAEEFVETIRSILASKTES